MNKYLAHKTHPKAWTEEARWKIQKGKMKSRLEMWQTSKMLMTQHDENVHGWKFRVEMHNLKVENLGKIRNKTFGSTTRSIFCRKFSKIFPKRLHVIQNKVRLNKSEQSRKNQILTPLVQHWCFSREMLYDRIIASKKALAPFRRRQAVTWKCCVFHLCRIQRKSRDKMSSCCLQIIRWRFYHVQLDNFAYNVKSIQILSKIHF